MGKGAPLPPLISMAGRTEISETQAAFLEWLLTPPAGRVPSGQNEWARQNDVAPQTVARWKNSDPLFKATWEKKLAEMSVGPERLQIILDALFAEAQTGDVQAAKAYIAWVEKISPPSKTEKDEASIEDMTDEEFADFVDGLAALRGTRNAEA